MHLPQKSGILSCRVDVWKQAGADDWQEGETRYVAVSWLGDKGLDVAFEKITDDAKKYYVGRQ